MKRYHLINNITGWATFAIASIVYILTIEPTASFWDCGEYISTSYKLEVGHPPGNPVFNIVARFFTLFAFGNTQLVSLMVNIMSALASAFTILFLFWTITHLAKKIVIKTYEDLNNGNIVAIMGSGLVGALCYTFSDSFWFSAVEAEVYASSSFFTAIVFWAIFKWENVSDQRNANRWLILIAYLMGLSIGVHLLNLLAIPAIVFVYYFKKYSVTKRGIIYASIISVLLLASLMYGVIPGVVQVAAWFELLFVNGFNLPFNSGFIFYIIVLLACCSAGIYFTNYSEKRLQITIFTTLALSLLGVPFMAGTVLGILLIITFFIVIYVIYYKNRVLLNTILLGFTVVMIGYSSYAMVVIRSNANPPLDENNPEHVFALLSYLNREQYGDRPLFYGPVFNAPIDRNNPVTIGQPIYTQKDGKYIKIASKDKQNYDAKFMTFFPRMWSQQDDHVEEYKKWIKEGKQIKSYNDQDEIEYITVPSFFDNVKYFLGYQLGFMYFRYFMWNFVGRQNDIQGHGNNIHGNWISGITFIDAIRLGPQNNIPNLLLNNKGRNTYYFLPLILGLLGLMFQFQYNRNDFILVALMFFFTGIAIVIYLNQYPFQPRERDYAYVGSFYAFAIWVGIGVLQIVAYLKKIPNAVLRAALATGICLFCVPYIMAKENWDDHDRSGRFTARDLAKNYLNSCAPNAILFTNGDNDTFPLWYVQEVEGIRTDVRVVNLSLYNTDWYINQMRRKAYDSDPIPLSLTYDQYIQGKREIVYLEDNKQLKEPLDIEKAIEFACTEDPRAKISQYRDINFIPTKRFKLSVDSATVFSNGTLSLKDTSIFVKQLEWSYDDNKRYLSKSDFMALALIAANKWKRPIYFAITVGDDAFLGLQDYFQLEGLAYRLVPTKTMSSRQEEYGRINTDLMYDNIMSKFKWENINNSKVYYDENNLRMIMNQRSNFARLAEALIDENKKDSALKVLDYCMELFPFEIIPHNYFSIGVAHAYYRLGKSNKANDIVRILSSQTDEEITYYLSVISKSPSLEIEIQKCMIIFQQLARITRQYQQAQLNKMLEEKFQAYYNTFEKIMQRKKN